MEPRQNQLSLQGLLKFAVSCSKAERAEDAIPDAPDYQNMDEERRAFLKSAMARMNVDYIEEFRLAIATLEDSNSLDADIIESVDNISDYVNNIDLANNFIRVGGAPVLLKHLKSENPQVLVSVMYCLGEMTQNNPFSQDYFLKLDLLPTLMENLKSADDDCGAAAVHAISTMVRHYNPTLLAFVRLGGVQALLDCIDSENSRKFIKACFLIANISTQSAEVKDDFIAINTIEKLSQHFEIIREFDDKVENVLYSMKVLARCEKWKPEEKYKNDLTKKLEEFIEINDESPPMDEMTDYCKSILVSLKGNTS